MAIVRFHILLLVIVVPIVSVNPLRKNREATLSINWFDHGRSLNFDQELSHLFRRTGLSYGISDKLKEVAGIQVTPCNLHYVDYKLGNVTGESENRGREEGGQQEEKMYYLIRLHIAGGEAKGQNWNALIRRVNKSDNLVVDYVSRLS